MKIIIFLENYIFKQIYPYVRDNYFVTVIVHWIIIVGNWSMYKKKNRNNNFNIDKIGGRITDPDPNCNWKLISKFGGRLSDTRQPGNNEYQDSRANIKAGVKHRWGETRRPITEIVVGRGFLCFQPQILVNPSNCRITWQLNPRVCLGMERVTWNTPST